MEPILRRDAVDNGVTDWDLQKGVSSGSLVRIGRGAYVGAIEYEDLAPDQRHRVKALSSFPRFEAGTVLSHRSEAAMHHLPMWNVDLSRVDVTRSGTTTRSTKRTNFFGHSLDQDDVVHIDGVPVTALGRTVLDLACLLPFEEAVVPGDAAVRLGGVLPDVPKRPGAARARSSLRFLNGLSESAGESRSRVLFHRRGVPAPLLQQPIYGEHYIGRVDFLWPEFSVVGEFDGEVKYSGRFGDGTDARISEKHREDAIRSLDWQVVRWCWDDLDDPSRLMGALRRAFRRGRRHPRFAA